MLATPTDVQAALTAMRRPELAEALPDVTELLAQASDLVAGYLWPSTAPTPTPPAISRVTAEMAATALIKASEASEILPETQSLQADGFGVTFAPGANSPGPYLTAAQKIRLRPYRSRATSVALGSDRF